jgi:large subunit ribosomal protein L23
MIDKSPKIVLKQYVTEKASRNTSFNQYAFKVHSSADKFVIKKAVEKEFNVKVNFVNVINIAGKKRRFGKTLGKRSDWKKVYVTLKAGYSINIDSGTVKD